MLFINSLHIHDGEISSAGKTKKMEALELYMLPWRQAQYQRAFN